MAAAWKTVRVFISSTFRDMHAERDHLVKVVFPALRERLEKHSIHLIDIDLRWGVTREQAENDQALDLCLQQIDECRPFFIGILGERYGWVPTRYPADALRKFGWIQHHTGKSVTELEILHGVLQDSEMRGRAFFYFRNPVNLHEIPEDVRLNIYADSDLECIHKLKDLKQEIRSSGYPVMETYPARWDAEAYDRPSRSNGRLVDLDEFGQRVHDQLWQAIQDEYQLSEQPVAVAVDPLVEEQDYHERFMESRLRVYVGREQINDELLAFADGNDRVPCLVTGPSGSGKSAALARFVQSFSLSQISNLKSRILILPHFIGASPRSTSLRDMLRRFCQVLKARFGFAEDVPEEAAKLSVTLREFVGRVPADARVLLVIDALNQLDETDRAQELYWLPTEFPPQVKVIVSCIDSVGRVSNPSQAVDGLETHPTKDKAEPVLEAFRHRKHCSVQLAALTDAEQRLIIRQVPSLSAKTLDDDQVRLLLSNPATANPLFLLVALEELRGFAPYERLNERMAAFRREGDTVTAIFTQVIERLEEEFDRETVHAVLTLLASARRGLSERELQELLATSSNPKSKIKNQKSEHLFPVLRQLRPYLLSRASLIDFYHRNLFKAVRERYLPSEEQQRHVHVRLAEYFNAQDYWLESLEEQQRRAKTLPPTPRTANVRKVDELPWQLARCGQWDRLVTVLSEPVLLSLPSLYQLLAYWTEVEVHSPLRMLDTYERVTGNKSPSTAKPGLLEVVKSSPLQPDMRLRIADLLHARGHRALARLLYRDLLVYAAMLDKKFEAGMWGRLAQIEHEEGMLQEALASLQEQEFIVSTHWHDGKQLASCLTSKARLLLSMGKPAEGLTAACEAEGHARSAHANLELQDALAVHAHILVHQGEFDEALLITAKRRQFCQEQANTHGLAECLGLEAHVARERGQLSRAQELTKQEEALWRQCGVTRGLARAIFGQGTLLMKLGHVDQAISKLEEAVSIATDWNDQDLLVRCLGILALAVKARGELDRALTLMEKQAALARQIGDPSELAIALGNQANIYHDQGRLDKAVALHQEKEVLARQINDPMSLTFALINQGLLLTRDMRQPLDGLPKAKEAWRLAGEHGFVDLQHRMGSTVQMIFDAAIEQAEMLRQRGDSVAPPGSAIHWQSAIEVLQAVVHLARCIPSVPVVCKALGYEGDNLRRLGNANAAISCYLDAEQLARSAKHPPGIEYSLMGRALVFAQMVGEPKKAMPLVKEAEQICLQHNLAQELVFVREALQVLKDRLRRG